VGEPPKPRSVLPWVLGGCGLLLLLAIGFALAIVLLTRGGDDETFGSTCGGRDEPLAGDCVALSGS